LTTRSLLTSLAFLLALTVAAPPAIAAQVASPVASPVATSDDITGLFDIGDGRRMYLECRGTGGPTVILETGYRSPVDVWTTDLISPESPRTRVYRRTSSCLRPRRLPTGPRRSVTTRPLRKWRLRPVPRLPPCVPRESA
jgi:hypothetical protein